MARKWQILAVVRRISISWPRPVTEKGHFVLYTSDRRWFVIALTYLKREILLKMAEEEFGVVALGPILLPCDLNFLEMQFP